MRFRNIVNQFHNQNGLADTSTAKQTNFTTLGIRCEQINNLNAGDKHFSFSGLLDKFRRFLVNGTSLVGTDITGFINRLANNIHNTTQCIFTYGYFNRVARIQNILTSHKTLCRVHGYGPNGALTEVLGYFKNEPCIADFCFKTVQNFRQSRIKSDVHNSADYLGYFAYSLCIICHFIHPQMVSLSWFS